MSKALYEKIQAKRNRKVSDDEADAICEMAEACTDILVEVAERHRTKDTEAIIEAVTYIVEKLCDPNSPSVLTPDAARAIVEQHRLGQPITIDPAHAEEKKSLEQQLAELQKTVNDSKSGTSSAAAGLGPATSGGLSQTERFEALCAKDPRLGGFILESFETLTSLRDPDELRGRTAIASGVINGVPALKVTKLSNNRYELMEIVERDKTIKELKDKLNPSALYSIGWKAREYDFHESNDPDSYTTQLAKARGDLSTLQADAIKKTDVRKAIGEVKTKLGEVKVGGMNGAKKAGIDDVKTKLEDALDLVK
ncbi:MAG TPA: hypothetical protein VFZ58_02585 [Candidatus Saccharimonadales bacterium]